MPEQNMEEFNEQYMMQQYDELLTCDKLGYYNSCEMITVFINEKETGNIYNFYTIFVMEERPTIKEECNFVTKLISVSKRFSMGIQRKVQEAKKIRPLIQSLCESKERRSVDIGDGELQIGRLEMVPKTFIPKDSTLQITLNRVLKKTGYKE